MTDRCILPPLHYLRLALQLALLVVMLTLGLQLNALSHTLEHNHLQQEHALKEHQQFVDEHERRMERY